MLKQISNLQFGEFTLDTRLRELRRGDEVLSIPGKAFDLLSYMASNPGRPLTKAELLDAVWPETTVEESNLSQNVFLLRKALDSGSDGPIKTLAGRGYQFAAKVAEVEPAATAPAVGGRLEGMLTMQATQTRVVVHDEVEEESLSRPRWPLLALLLLVLVVVGTLGWRWRQRWLDRTGGAPVDVVLTSFEGSTGDLILDGALVDALRMDLSQSPFVSVVSPARLRQTLTEMKHSPDQPMTAAIAREVCERTNSQAVLRGSVARLGEHYLLTEEATSCVNGTVLAEAKYEASAAQDLPNTVNRIAESLRRKLGESRRSIERFDTPLFSGNTASLEALKSYSQAEVQSGQGKYVDAIDLMKKAIAADPGFAEAYYDLATFFRATLDHTAERQAILKAYSLRDSASEPVRLAINALYHSDATQDLYEAERNYRNWTELYPRSAQAWNGLSTAERELGHHKESLIAAQRALQLGPSVLGAYARLSYEQRQTGDYKGSLVTCQRALAQGLDGDYIRDYLLQTAYALHDPALVQQQREWAAVHPDAIFFRVEELEIAIAEGRFKDAHRLLPQIVALMRHHGLAGVADDLIRSEAVNLIEVGDVAEGIQLFRSVPVDPRNDISVVGLAAVGDFASAESSLRAMQAEFPQGTIWNDYRGPQVQAMIALAKHKPTDALAALERVRPLDGRNPVLPMLRADAHLAAGDSARAEESYRRVAEGAFQNPDEEELPLSWLGLGRALAAEGHGAAAVDAYQHFFTLWAHADPDAIYLKQAKTEFATLQTARLAK